MNKRKEGQGLIEYALLLGLAAFLAWSAQSVVYKFHVAFSDLCATAHLLYFHFEVDVPFHREYMDIGDEVVKIWVGDDFPPECQGWVKIHGASRPLHGTVSHFDDDFASQFVFYYRPDEVGSTYADFFTYSWEYTNPLLPDTVYHGQVSIEPRRPDGSMASASIMRGAEPTTRTSERAKESVQALWEEVAAQQESLEEAMDLSVEAIVEGLEVLIDFADDDDNQALSESLSELMQEVKDGNLATVPDVLNSLGTELGEVPLEVWIAMSLKMAPRLIDSCEQVSTGSVSPETMTAALQAVEQVDDPSPGKTEALERLQAAVDILEEGNGTIEDYVEGQSALLDMIVAGLEFAGEEELAEQITADMEVCGN